MADQKRQLILDLLARDKTKQATDSASKNLDGVGESAEVAAKATEKLGKEADKSEDQVQRFGKSNRTAAEHVELLDHEIKNVERELRQLAVSFAEADAAAEKMDLSKAIRRTQADLRKLNQSKGLVSELLPDEKETDDAGRTFAQRLTKSIGGGLTELSSTLGGSVGPTIGAAIGAVAAPVLISAIGSVVASGAGVGALGVGIMAAVKGSREIQDAGKSAGQRFMKGLQDEAQVLRGPVLKSIDVLSAAGDRLNKNLGTTFDALSGHLVPFVSKVAEAGENITNSLLGAAKESGPAIDALGDSIVYLSDGISTLINNLADGGPEAASNLRLVAGATSDLISVSSGLLPVLAKLSNEPLLTGPLLPLLRDHYDKAAEGASQLAAKTENELTPSIDGATAAAQRQLDVMKMVNDEIKAEADPLFAFVKAQEAVKTAQTKVNEAIKKYGPTSAQASAATRDLAEAAIGLQGAAAGVGIAADGKLSPALRRALVQAGLTKQQIRGVESQLRSAKAALDRYDGTNARARVSVDTAAATNRVRALQSQINRMKGKTIPITVRITKQGEVLLGNQAPQMRAAGGPVKAGQAYIVGEKRPEVFVPDSNGKIIPSVSQLASSGISRGTAAAGGSDPGWVAIRGDAVLDALVQAIASRVSAKGGRAAQLGIRFT